MKFPILEKNPSTLVFVKNIGHNYDFEGWGGVVSGRVWGWGWMVQIQRKQYIFTYSKCLDYLSNQIILLVPYFKHEIYQYQKLKVKKKKKNSNEIDKNALS